MARLKLGMTFDIPNVITDSRPWQAVEGEVSQGLNKVRAQGVPVDDFVAAFYNGTNQTIIFKQGV